MNNQTTSGGSSSDAQGAGSGQGASSASRAASSLSLPRMAVAGLKHNWRVTLSVAVGVATATAVIVGALLVGDSMRGSLRGLTVERLGEVHTAVIPGGFFPAEEVFRRSELAEPLLFFPSGAIEAQSGDEQRNRRRVGSIQIIGCDDSFWDLDVLGVRPAEMPNDEGIVLNRSAASQLGVEVGDRVTLRLPVESAVPADSPLGRRDVQTEGLPRMEVLDIVPDEGLGRFALAPNQATPLNVYAARETLAEVLQREGQANALLLREGATEDDLQLDLAAMGLDVQRIRREFTPESGEPTVIYDYYSLTSERLLVPELVVQRVTESLPERTTVPLLTYLANAIERVNDQGEVVASVPYSTITATESTDDLPLDFDGDASAAAESAAATGDPSTETAARRVPMVLNRWTAEQLSAEVGDRLRVAYYEPEVDSGQEIERAFDAVVTDIVPLTQPATPYRRGRPARFDQPPTVYNDPDLTPTVPGVTDQESISDWDLPFALDREITREDDEYWNHHRLTPKAFLPLSDGRRLFGSRFGQTTSVRIDAAVADNADELAASILAALQPVREELGWALIPVREQQLSASRGTTPFDALFLSLSLFVILAAVMLIAMLFRLGLVERVRQFGTLMAVGWTPRRVAGLAFLEGLGVATVGVVLGAAGGVGYARLVLHALRSWWVGAVTVPFLQFHWTPLSLAIGVFAGWIVSAIAIAVTIRSLLRADAQSLLSGRTESSRPESSRPGGPSASSDSGDGERKKFRSRWLGAATAATVVAALAVAAFGATSSGQEAAAGFVGAGMLLLMAALLTIHRRLRRPRRIDTSSQAGTRSYSLLALVSRSASRHPIRSTLSIGLMAAAAFLIVAMSAFRLQPSDQGTGGFDLIATTSQPLFRDLADPLNRQDLLGSDAEVLEGMTVAAFRLRQGQDASCNNLYQASQPTVLGVPASFGDQFRSTAVPSSEAEETPAAEPSGAAAFPGFQWAAAAPLTAEATPWDLLSEPAAGTAEDPIPMIIDQNTAMWSLQMREGIGEVKSFEYELGKPVYFQVVGLLANSMLQGQLLIGEGNFETTFPAINGYRFFLLGGGERDLAEVGSVLENRLGDIGMDVRESREVLASLLAVQNTYLRTFQSLGALGLLLGTVGLAVAQMRSVLERRREMAVMRAIGFTRRRLATIVLGETAALLLAGIGCGVGCAVLAVMPYAVANAVRPPVVEPLVVVLGVILFGMLAGLLAVRRVLSLPLLSSLRAD